MNVLSRHRLPPSLEDKEALYQILRKLTSYSWTPAKCDVTTGIPYVIPLSQIYSHLNPCYLGVMAIHEAVHIADIWAVCQKCKAEYDKMIQKEGMDKKNAANFAELYYKIWERQNLRYLECRAYKAGYAAAIAAAAVACTGVSSGCPPTPTLTPCCAGTIKAIMDQKAGMDLTCPGAPDKPTDIKFK
jgi:hypothetical protein